MKTRQLTLLEHNRLVIDEAIMSPLNRWATGMVIRHAPDVNDPNDRNALIMHFVEFGGVEHLYISYTHDINVLNLQVVPEKPEVLEHQMAA